MDAPMAPCKKSDKNHLREGKDLQMVQNLRVWVTQRIKKSSITVACLWWCLLFFMQALCAQMKCLGMNVSLRLGTLRTQDADHKETQKHTQPSLFTSPGGSKCGWVDARHRNRPSTSLGASCPRRSHQRAPGRSGRGPASHVVLWEYR